MTKVNKLLLEEEPVYGPSSSADNTVAIFDGTTGKLVKDSGILIEDIGSGDVVGPSSSTADAVALWSGTTGKLLEDGRLIQTSEIDPVAGRLMGVGAFGLGATANLTSPDLSQIRPSGKYFCNSPTNGPAGTANGWLNVQDLSATYAYHQFTDLTGLLWDNYLNNGVWRGWRRVSTETGTFTPGLSFGGGAVGVTYATQLGTYTRVGRLVTATGQIVLSSNGSSTGQVRITGLPFASNSTYYTSIAFGFHRMTGLSGMLQGLVDVGTTNILLYQWGASSSVALTKTAVPADAILYFTVTYEA